MAINVTVSGGTGIDVSPQTNVDVSGGTGIDGAPATNLQITADETSVEVTGGIGPAAFVNNLGDVVGVGTIVGGDGITISTASGSLTFSGRSDSEVASLSPVQSVLGRIGDVTLTVQDLTAAAAVHTHSTTEVTGLTATIQQYGNVTSVNDYTGDVTLTVQDLTAAAAVHTHSTTEVTGLTATIQQYGKVLSVNDYTGDVTLTVQDLTAAAAVHTHSTTEVTGLTATIQQYGNVTSVNTYTGDVTLVLQDLGEVSSSSPSIGDALFWDGSEWYPDGVPVGTTINNLSGDVGIVGGEGIVVASEGQNLTISSSVSGVSAINGLSGNISLIAGDNINITQSGQNVSVSADTPVQSINTLTGNLTIQSGAGIVVNTTTDGLITIGRPTVPQHGVAAWQGLDGNVTLMWDAIPDPAESDYAVEVLEVDNQSVPTGNISMVAEPKITVNVQADVAAQELSLVFLPSGTALDESSSAFADGLLVSDRNAAGWSPESISLTVDGLPDTITAPGDFDVYGKTVDPAGYETAWTLIGTAAATSHGKPSPPLIVSFDGLSDGTARLAIEAAATIHMRGFVAESTISFEAQVSTTPEVESSWAAFATIQPGSTTATAILDPEEVYTVRVRSVGPFGAGEWAVQEQFA